MRYIVRLDMPNHPETRLRAPHWLYRAVGDDDVPTATPVRANAQRFDNRVQAQAALDAFLAYWTHRRRGQVYNLTIEEFAGYKVRWVVKTWCGGPSRELTAATTRGHILSGGSSTRGINADLYVTPEAAEEAARLWLTHAISNPGARVVARRVPL